MKGIISYRTVPAGTLTAYNPSYPERRPMVHTKRCKQIPFLRISGKKLQKIGLEIGSNYVLTVENNRIIIEAVTN